MVINSEDLKNKLKLLGYAISKDTTAQPNRLHILFMTQNNIVYMYACSGINNIRIKIGTSNEDLYAVVPYSIFTNFIKSCDGDVTIVSDESSLKIKASNVKCKLPITSTTSSDKTIGIPDPTKMTDTYDKTLDKELDLNIIKANLDQNHVVTAYRYVYFSDNIMVSDTDNVVIIKDNIFNTNLLLDYSSVELLTNITNCKYTIKHITSEKSTGKIKSKLEADIICLTSDELDATIMTMNQDDYQYADIMDLFGQFDGNTIEIDTKELTKAMSTSQLFNKNPNIIFNNKGIFLSIESVGFMYKISDTSCSDRIFELDPVLAKKIVSLGSNVNMYYESKDMIKCDIDNVEAIFSIKEVE